MDGGDTVYTYTETVFFFKKYWNIRKNSFLSEGVQNVYVDINFLSISENV